MNQPLETPIERTPEQHAAVRRRSAPIALGGVICGIGALVMLMTRNVNHTSPPNIFAMNLSFCAMMIGVGILFYVKGTPGARTAITFSLLSLLTGLVGPMLFAKQSLTWRLAIENQELANVVGIVTASRTYAQGHDGKFPPDLNALLDAGLLTAEHLHSPFGNGETITMQERVKNQKMTAQEFATWYARHSDYDYYGGDYTLQAIAASTRPAASAPAAPAPDFSRVIIAASTDVIMSSKLSAGFLDGHGEFIGLEGAEAALKATNDARAGMNLPVLRPPRSIEHAREMEREDKARQGG
jgi:hypothetical protein